MKIICLHPNLLRRMLEPLGTTEIQRFQGAHGSAAAAAMAPLPGVTNRKLVHNLFSSEMSAGRGRLSPTLLAAPFRFIPAPGDITVSRSMLAAPFRDPCSHHVAAMHSFVLIFSVSFQLQLDPTVLCTMMMMIMN